LKRDKEVALKPGWKLVARLGDGGERYPHVLTDPHGWCLRLGPSRKQDEKYYSSLTTLLLGMLEQGTRRYFLHSEAAVGVRDLAELVGRGVDSMVRLASRLEATCPGSPGKSPAARNNVDDAPAACPASQARQGHNAPFLAKKEIAS
jgi:hypothetical protein